MHHFLYEFSTKSNSICLQFKMQKQSCLTIKSSSPIKPIYMHLIISYYERWPYNHISSSRVFSVDKNDNSVSIIEFNDYSRVEWYRHLATNSNMTLHAPDRSTRDPGETADWWIIDYTGRVLLCMYTNSSSLFSIRFQELFKALVLDWN